MRTALAAALTALALSGCSSASPRSQPSGTPSQSVPASSSERPVPAESNPPGDIPDNQVFVNYRAGGGFEVKVPEGWSRRNTASGVAFTDKLNSVLATWYSPPSPPTPQRARDSDIPRLRRSEHAFTLRGMQTVSLPGGTTVLITFQTNSAPNAVTGRQYRLDVLLYEFYRSGKEADLMLSSPVGADNVDPWRIVSRSFAWR